MKHPIVTDKIQTFIAKNGLLHLLFLYLLFTLFFSFLISLIWSWISLKHFEAEVLIYRIWYSFVFLYGYQPNLQAGFEEGAKLISVFLSIGSVVFPTILLGTFVYKIFLPKKARVIFRDKASIHQDENKSSFIAIHCYLGSRLYYADWVFRVYIRTYIESKKKEFPLQTYPVDLKYSDVPLPYTLMPTQILIPYALDVEKNSSNYDNGIVFKKVGNDYKLVRIGCNDVSEDEIVEYEIIILTSGRIPELRMDFMETKTYHSSDIDFSEQFEIETLFDIKNKKGSVQSWNRF